MQFYAPPFLRLNFKAPLLFGYQLDLSPKSTGRILRLGGEILECYFPLAFSHQLFKWPWLHHTAKTTASLNSLIMQLQVLFIPPCICPLRSGDGNDFLLLLTPGYFSIPPLSPLTLFRPLEMI